MTDKTREDFEEAFMEMYGSDWSDIDNPVERMDCGEYFFPGVQTNWTLYQAAAERYRMDAGLLDEVDGLLVDFIHVLRSIDGCPEATRSARKKLDAYREKVGE